MKHRIGLPQELSVVQSHQESKIKTVSRSIGELLTAASLWPIVSRHSDSAAKFTAAREVIEDTEVATCAYEGLTESSDRGLLYLVTYGVLEALSAQHLALEELGRELAFVFEIASPYLKADNKEVDKRLRVRHHASAHSVNQGKPGSYRYFGISAPSLQHGSFTLVDWDRMVGKTRDKRLEEIDLFGLIQEQRSIVETTLDRALAELESLADSLAPPW